MANAYRGGGYSSDDINSLINRVDRLTRSLGGSNRSNSRSYKDNNTDAKVLEESFKKALKDAGFSEAEQNKKYKDWKTSVEKQAKTQETLTERLNKAFSSYDAALEAFKNYGGSKDTVNEAKRRVRDLENKKFAADFRESFKNDMISVIGTSIRKITSSFDQYITTITQYTTAINTRLQGSDKNWQTISNTVNRALGTSPFVKQTAVYENLNKLVAEGISYNVEQRAFLATVSDKIATTFDAANGTLLQLIRIQQADSTAARLGLESSLNKFLNSTFKDTSYLTNGFDNVSAALLGANSQLSRNGSVAFEYAVQKWLGSMASVGVSDSTIQNLARGLNALGTGDISSLAGDTALQNLLVMAASNAGLDYAQMLTGGMNATTANQLLESVVRYGQQIASSNNQVVKSQYAQLFGMTISDLTSLLNLSSQDLVSISKNMLDYSGAIRETTNELSSIGSRMTLKDKIDTAFANVTATLGEGIVNNPFTYATWLITDMIEGMTGGINIPTVSWMGNSVDLGATVTQLMKLGIVGTSTLMNIGTVVSALSNSGSLSLDRWGAEETTGRGRGLSTALAEGNFARTNSASMFVGNSSSSDMYNSTIAAATNDAKASVEGQEENELLVLLRDKIAIDVHSIAELLVSGITIGSISEPLRMELRGA